MTTYQGRHGGLDDLTASSRWPRSSRSSPQATAAAEVHRLRRQHRRARRRRARAGPADPARHHLPGHRARRPRVGPRLRVRRPRAARRAPRRPVRAAARAGRQAGLQAAAGAGAGQHRRARSASSTCMPIAPPPQEALPRWRRIAEGLRHSKTRDADAIHHHYDVSNTFYEWVLGPSMTYTCACYPDAGRDARGGAGEQVPAGVRQAAAAAGRPAARRRLRLGRHGALRGRATACKAIGVTLSEEQAAWAQKAIAERGPVRPRRGAPRRLPRRARVRLRRGVLDRADRAHRRAELPVVLPLPASRRCAPAALLLNHCITRPDNRAGATAGGFIDRYVFPDGELTGSGRIITEVQDVGLEVVHEENLRHHYAMTLRDWCANLVEHWDEAVAEVGLPTAKVWGLYMAGSRLGFETQCRFSCTRFWRSSWTTRAATAACRCARGGRPKRRRSGARPARSAVAPARPPRGRGAVAACSWTAWASMLSSSSSSGGAARDGRLRAARGRRGAVGDPPRTGCSSSRRARP